MARQRTAPAREKRRRTIGAFIGSVERLIEELGETDSPQRIRTYSEATADDLVVALRLLGGIDGVGIVVHGPRGCGASIMETAPGTNVIVTHLAERDTIMGSDKVLKHAANVLVSRCRPWALFLVATPVVAINNDDLRVTAAELADELAIPVLPVYCDGFRSRIGDTGFDVAFHALLDLIPGHDGPPDPGLVNLLSVTGGKSADAMAELLERLGLRVNLLPAGSVRGSLAAASRAAASIAIDSDSAGYPGHELEIAHHVPFVPSRPPIGVRGTRNWLEVVAAATGVHEKAAEVHETGLASLPAALGRTLAGVDVWLGFPPAAALGVAGLVAELGGRVGWVSADYFDATHIAELKTLAERCPGLLLHVGSGQSFEAANLLRLHKPALFIGTPGRAADARRAGIPAVGLLPDELTGYRGVSILARRSGKALRNRGFVDALSRETPSAYRDAWLRRSPDWHIKLEVR
ncbi:MAG TPA: nitrogenase component 1 [Candidatus Deferrimicrobiaceae bacterium]